MADSTSLVLYDPRTADPEVIAVAGFLAGYSGRTREAYALDLRQFFAWCSDRQLRLFDAHRADIELYARDLEEHGKAKATIGRRLSTIAGFYRYAAEEGLIEHSPAVHVRRPRLDYESHAVGLDRNELGAFLVAAGLASAQDHALASLLALNGLRISEALGADIDDLGLERGHRTLVVHRKGGKTVHPAGPPHGPGRRPGHRRTTRRAHLRRRLRRPPAPRLGGQNGAPPGQAGRHRQAHRPPQPTPLLHHRRPRRWSGTARRAGGGLPRRSPHHHALRPGPPVPGPPRHLYRGHLRGRRLPGRHRLGASPPVVMLEAERRRRPALRISLSERALVPRYSPGRWREPLPMR